ncbi:hypothetical protein LXT12_06690 [Pelomonas sp. P7]|uniref:Right handed beta helix region n=1 Tax=Pelomonas caseinilytica TaxID=2906763 RepID=A0ABS8X8B1_9BURK|nr:PDZ domain-containing protein [Pelomonas sp. P7]MCE4536934.1 hypothetical protein [Pelomonas sp. P7]
MRAAASALLTLAAALAVPAWGAAPVLRVADVAALREALATVAAGGQTRRIELAAGRYALDAPLQLDERHSGRAGAPLEIAAAPGARVVLSGAVPLPPLAWQAWRDGIWRAQLTGRGFQRLWLGEHELTRARYPNLDPRQPMGGTAADATAPERIARWQDPTGGVLHAMHGLDWGGVQVPILGKKPDGSLDFGPQVGNNRVHEPDARRRWVDNILEELDAPDEWYLDTRGGWLYVKPASGRTPARGFRASATEALVRIEGRGGHEAHDIRLQGLVFEDTEPTFLKATEPLLRSDWKFHRVGAVTIENARGVSVEDGDFRALGGHAVVVNGRAEAVRIAGNHIHDIGGSAIAFVGRPGAVRSPLYEYGERLELAAIDPLPGPRSDDYPKDSEAVDNLVHDIGHVDKQAAGIEIAMAARITVDHNTLHHLPRAAINVGDGTWGGHVISHNDAFDTVLETGDHGSFNSWGRDRWWHPDRAEMDRRVAAHPGLTALDPLAPIVIRRNRLRCDRGWDIDLDDGSSNYLIEQNLLLAGGLKLREGFRRIVRNNILVNGGFHPHVWFKDSGDVFEANIVMRAHAPVNIQHWGLRVDGNAFTREADLRQARAAGTDAHSIAADPGFADPTAGDYTVTNAKLLRAIGFQNFPMDDFGVRPARLRALAAQPPLPRPDAAAVEVALEAPRTLANGLTVKTVQTLGEQSAAGLGRPAGVLVLAVQPGSAAERAGYRARDVIVATASGSAIDDVAALAALTTPGEWVLVRNQARLRLPSP